ncbi:MAG: hypothetical protein QW153_02525 [Candidatus Bilamarchaeaceae archaeon]
MVDWKRAAYRALKKYDRLCSINNCTNSGKLNRDLSLLIEDLRKSPPSSNEQYKLLSAVKNAGVCVNCGFSNDRARDANSILILVRTASKCFEDLKKGYEDKINKLGQHTLSCNGCQFFEVVFEDFAIAVSISQNNRSVDFTLKPQSKINPHGVAATELCAAHNCKELNFTQALLEDVAQDYLNKKEETIKIETSELSVRRKNNISFLFEDEQTKIYKITKNNMFSSVINLAQLNPSLQKLEKERISKFLSILNTFGFLDGVDADNLPKRWIELFENKKFSELDKEIKLVESAKVIESDKVSFYLYEKIDALEFLLQNSKKTKEEIVAQLRKKDNLTDGEIFILEKI